MEISMQKVKNVSADNILGYIFVVPGSEID